MAQTAQDSFQLARSHLQRVQTSWNDPTDWTILSTFGFYCLEAYGDTPPPSGLDAEDVAIEIEEYVDSVSGLLAP